jgi:two-component system, LytTR family, response regulator
MTNRLKTLIVDDEQDAVNFIASIIREYCPRLDIIGTAFSAKDGVKFILEHSPDLVFLDVEMPHGSGFDLLHQFPEKTFDVIFITAFNHYAIRAIKFSAVDYILKPINISEFREAVEKVIQKRSSDQNRISSYSNLLENLQTPQPSKLAIPTSEGMEYLNTMDIIRVEADRGYSWFILTNKRKVLVSRNLKEYQELLGEQKFFRPHNSHLINLEHVRKYIRHEGTIIEMDDGSQVPLSRPRKEFFLSQMSHISR